MLFRFTIALAYSIISLAGLQDGLVAVSLAKGATDVGPAWAHTLHTDQN